MARHEADIVIYGAGIAGLWACKALKARGYDVLVLEKDAIGGGQTMASQGIIHSGLKYALGGKILPLAKEISAMPARWRETLKGECMAAPSQQLFIPKGFVGGIAKTAVNAIFDVREVEERPGGFEGSVLEMSEPVLDVGKVLRMLADTSCIRKTGGEKIHAKAYIYTAAADNEMFAAQNGSRVEMQRRPLLMGMMKHAPFPLFAHFVGTSDKPEATVTTHKTNDGALVWYVGGGVAERAKESDPVLLYKEIKKIFARYLPGVDLSGTEWSALSIDRVEGKSGAWMPDRPTIIEDGDDLYCWPTKLTFAPLLADMIAEKVKDIKPSGASTDWSFLPAVDFAAAPWDRTEWKKSS